jgi:murein L,D-transpeptidase YcbB/YkuD
MVSCSGRVGGLLFGLALGLLPCRLSAQIVVPPPQSEIAANADADPLTPPPANAPAPQAPGASAGLPRSDAGAGAIEPVVALLRDRLSGAAAVANGNQAEDRSALAIFYSAVNKPLWTTPGGYAPRALAAIAEMQKAADYGLEPQDFAVSPAPASAFADTAAQAEAELTLSLAVMRYARHARGSRVDPGKISAMIDLRPKLYDPKSVIVALAASADAADTLRKFHPQHQGFQNLRKALLAERQTPSGRDTLQRIIVNLERWRWMPDDLGSLYVWDNIPEQITRVIKDGKMVLSEKIVVGKPSSPTPQFSANMQFVIFHPSWGVPDGIKRNEVGPLLRQASASNSNWLFGDSNGASRALARHQLKVTYNGRDVNPDSVDWSRADVRQYQFTQPPSSSNVLGVVKFRFPNRFDVYMHDTPERNLFNAGTRAFSHGCMRVQNPIHLAEVILGYDKGWSAEKVRGMVKGGQAEITLSHPIPVHMTYFSAIADDEGKLQVHGDIYGMDARVASALAGKSVHLAAADATPASPGARPRKREVTRRGGSSGSPWQGFNPFSGLFGN